MAKSEPDAQKSTNSSIARALHYLAREMPNNDPLRLIIAFVAESLEQRCH